MPYPWDKYDQVTIQDFVADFAKPGVTFPSVQSVIEPDGTVRVVSSHEQILIDNNTYIGAWYKANQAYRAVVEKAAALRIADAGKVIELTRQADGSWKIVS